MELTPELGFRRLPVIDAVGNWKRDNITVGIRKSDTHNVWNLEEMTVGIWNMRPKKVDVGQGKARRKFIENNFSIWGEPQKDGQRDSWGLKRGGDHGIVAESM